jgi:hypothetical protein
MKKQLVLLSLFSVFVITSYCQEDYDYNLSDDSRGIVKLSTDRTKMIITEIDDFFAQHIQYSHLYHFPLKCEDFNELEKCLNYQWSEDNRFFAGDKSWYDYFRQIYLYDSTGVLLRNIKNGYRYSFVLPKFHVFYRQYSNENHEWITQLIHYDYENGKEQILCSFGADFSFYDPNDDCGFGYPPYLKYSSDEGALTGRIFKITKRNESGERLKFNCYKFSIPAPKEIFKYWYEGIHPDSIKLEPKFEIIQEGIEEF